jgi:hypothetical protein
MPEPDSSFAVDPDASVVGATTQQRIRHAPASDLSTISGPIDESSYSAHKPT